MEERYYLEIQAQLRALEARIQSEELSYRELAKIVEDLRKLTVDIQQQTDKSEDAYGEIIASVDKDLAVTSEKLSNVFYQLGQLDKRITALEDYKAKSSDNIRSIIEKIFMAILGGLVTYGVSLMLK